MNKRIFQLPTTKTNNFTISFNLKSLTALQKFTISSTITNNNRRKNYFDFTSNKQNKR